MAGFAFILSLFIINVVQVDAIRYSSRFVDPGLSGEFRTPYIPCPDHCTCDQMLGDHLEVYCEQEGLTEIPANIPENTTILDLGENIITELPESGFTGLRRLEQLLLPTNDISKMTARSLVGQSQLKILVLSENRQISGSLSEFIFSSLTSLIQLDLANCELKYFNVKTFLNLTKLARIDLSGNLFTMLPDFVYRNSPLFPNLQWIAINDNSIKSISYYNLSKLPHLSVVRINANKIEDICSHDVSFLANENNANDLSLRSFHVQKHMADVIGSKISNGNKWSRSYLVLTQFELSNNKIRVLTANCFATLNYLERLLLAGNLITTIHALAFNRLKNLIYLSLAGNQIVVYEDGVFSPATSLEWCDLSNGKTKTLNINAFQNLTNLEILILDLNNFTNIPDFGKDSSTPALHNLEVLSLVDNQIVSLGKRTELINRYEMSNNLTQLWLDRNPIVNLTPSDYYKHFPRLKRMTINHSKIREMYPSTSSELVFLEKLELNHNPINILHDGAFGAFCSLAFLDLSHCNMDKLNVKAFVNMTSLRNLLLDYNTFSDFPNFIHSNNTFILPNLTSLSMEYNTYYLQTVTGLGNLPSLQTLTLNGNEFNVPVGVFEKLYFLKRLNLMKGKISISKSGLKSSSLSHIVLNDTKLTFNQFDVFEELPKLQVLLMPNCKQDSRSHKDQAFRNMIHLEIIDLSNTGIIPNSGTFVNSTSLKHLNLNDNRLGALDRNMFKQMNRLESLMLSNTSINSVNYTSLPEIFWTHLRGIDLSRNFYICDCDIVWFRNWLNTTNVTILNSNEYKCEFPLIYKNRSIQSLPEFIDMECFKAPFDSCIYAVFLVVFVVLLASSLVSLLHRFRWHVRYWQSVVMTRRRQYRELVDQRHYDYDAFVMYCQQDSQWVINELRPRLENIDNLRLCIHHRDWLGGQDIMDNITESIEHSWKCLLIVSNAFAMSQWCHFELTMAQSRLFQEDRDSLVLVMLEEISECYVTPRLHLQMQRQTYIEWTGNVMGQQLFWARLGRALKGPNQSVTHSPLPQSVFREIQCDEE